MFKLLIEDDAGGQTVVPLVREELTIGRQEGNTIRLTERNVSRRHARLSVENGRVFIEEASARYGLKINGRRLTERMEFKEGDVLLVGDYRLSLQPEVKAAPAPAPEMGQSLSAEAPQAPSPFAQESTRIMRVPEAGAQPERTEMIATMPAKLVVISSNFAGQEFPLKSTEVVIGRGDGCQIIIDHRSVSQNHAKIVREANGSYKIMDLKSKNGVRVSGEEYRATYLKRGDIVELGHVKFRFVEPGENYVFTPLAGDAADGPEPANAGSAGKPTMVAVLAVVVLLLAGGSWLVLGRNAEADPAAAAEVQASAGLPVAGGAVDALGEKRVALIEKARKDISEGQLQRAVGTLESVREMDPTAEQQATMDDLISKARIEQPFHRTSQQAQDEITAGKFAEALQRLQSIPAHSMFHASVREPGGLFEQSLNGTLLVARAAQKAGDLAGARKLAELALAAKPDFTSASELLASLSGAPTQVALAAPPTMALADPVPVAPPAAAPKEPVAQREPEKPAAPAKEVAAAARKPEPAEKPTRPAKEPAEKPAAAPKLTPEESKAVIQAASTKLLKGDINGALADCQDGLRAGVSACNRVLGSAYAKASNNGKACDHYRAYLRSNPPDRGRVENEMGKLGCSP